MMKKTLANKNCPKAREHVMVVCSCILRNEKKRDILKLMIRQAKKEQTSA